MKGRAELETTGPSQALLGDAVTAAVSARHPTLNTKPLFKLMVEKKASDLFFTSNAPIKIKIEGQILPVNKQVLSPETVRQTAFALMSPEQRDHFVNEWELDFAVSEPGLGRFRVNVFMQRGFPAMVMRYITADMPRIDALGLPQVVSELTLLRRGLLLTVGATGSGKSTTLAAMIITGTRTPPITSSPSRTRSSSCIPTSARSSTSAKWASTPRAIRAHCAGWCARRRMSS